MLVAWRGGGQYGVSRVRNLSLGGLFISTAAPPPVGSILKLVFEVPWGEVRARAVVRSSKPGKGMGVEFTSMGHDHRGRLNRLMKKLAQ
jgi:hypothetical protein